MYNTEQLSSKSYASEIEAFAAYPNKHNITFSDFKLILKTFFSILIEEVINTGDNYIFPNKLGSFGIRKKDTWGRGVFDYQLYKETSIKRWKKNAHSDSRIGTFFWNTKYPSFDTKLPNTVFLFKASRDNTRYLSKQIRENNTINKYYDL